MNIIDILDKHLGHAEELSDIEATNKIKELLSYCEFLFTNLNVDPSIIETSIVYQAQKNELNELADELSHTFKITSMPVALSS